MNSVIQQMSQWLTDIRQDFHKHPELGFEEYRTSEQIQKYLTEMNIPYKIMAKTGVVADILGKDTSITIALRADIDALPIQDKKECEYKSTIDGKMHACGHDAHMTILLGVAKYFSQNTPPCSLRLLFQPAEETDGGAIPLINEGALKDIDGILGLHVAPSIPKGKIAIKYGCMNASSDMITIDLFGKSGHGAYPKDTVDTIVMASSLINTLQTVISRNIDGRESAVLTLGTIQGGVARNVICDSIRIEGTIRTLNNDTREFINNRVEQIIHSTAEAFGGKGKYTRVKGYTSLINHDKVVDIIKESGTNILGEDNVLEKELPNMGVEDFAYYLQEVKGAFFYLGVGNKNIVAPAHTELFDIDESALPIGVELQISNIHLLYQSVKATK